MNDFWSSKTGEPISGRPEDAFTQNFDVIPEGTKAKAAIHEFKLVAKEIMGEEKRYYEITWKIIEGPFASRQVSQKIKAMDSKATIAQRGLNMLKLVYRLCNHTPLHGNMPTDRDHAPMVGKHLGIKIGEWSMPKQDGSGFMEGNHVTEVHALQGFVAEVGIKKELPVIVESKVESAFSRNSRNTVIDLDEDLPF